VVSMDLSTRESDRQVVVALRGELDIADAASVAAALVAVAARAAEIIVDLAGLEFIDASGVAALVLARVQARRAGGDLLLAAPRPGAAGSCRYPPGRSLLRSSQRGRGGWQCRALPAGGRAGGVAAAQQDQRACAAMRSGTSPGAATGHPESRPEGKSVMTRRRQGRASAHAMAWPACRLPAARPGRIVPQGPARWPGG